jgi:hypothetical protein
LLKRPRNKSLTKGTASASAVPNQDGLMRALEAAEKLVFGVGRGFIPGINLVIFVAFRP